MRLINKTDETIAIEPGEEIDLEIDEIRKRGTVKRIYYYYINGVNKRF